MLLKDRILDIKDEYVYIGSKNAFVTIGKTKDFGSIIEEANNYHRGLIENQLNELYRMRDNIPQRYAWTECIVNKSKERIGTTKHLLEEMAAALGELAEYVNGNPKADQVEKFGNEYGKYEEKYEEFLAKNVVNGMFNALRRLDIVHASEAEIKSKIPVLEKKLEGWIPFEDREVISEYKRTADEPLGTILLVEGEEWGRYWSLDEVGKDITELEEDEDYE